MPSITIRNVDEPLKTLLRNRAARNGRSIGEEARQILHGALASETTSGETLAAAVRRWIDPVGGVDLPGTNRKSSREPPLLE